MQQRHTAPVRRKGKFRRTRSSFIEPHSGRHSPNQSSTKPIYEHSLPSLKIRQSHSLNADYDGCAAEEKACDNHQGHKPHPNPNSPQQPAAYDLNHQQAHYHNSSKMFSNPELAAMQLVPPQNQRISIASIFKYKKVLGKGVSCRVLLVDHKHSDKQYALKEMTRANRKNCLLFISEVNILQKLKHPHIVKFEDIFMVIHNYYIGMYLQ